MALFPKVPCSLLVGRFLGREIDAVTDEDARLRESGLRPVEMVLVVVRDIHPVHPGV